MTSESPVDQCKNTIQNVHTISSTYNFDDLLKTAIFADLEAMKGEILDEVQSKLEMFRESLEIKSKTGIISAKSRARKNSKSNQPNMNPYSHLAEKPSEMNSELGTVIKETHLDVVVDSSTQTDLQGNLIKSLYMIFSFMIYKRFSKIDNVKKRLSMCYYI